MHSTAPVLLPGTGEAIAKGAVVYPLFSNAPFHVTTFDVQPGCETPLDQHKVEEIWVIQSGSGELCYENHPMMVKAEDVVYFAAFKSHQIKNTGASVLKILSIYW